MNGNAGSLFVLRSALLGLVALLAACNDDNGGDDERVAVGKKMGTEFIKLSPTARNQAQALQAAGVQVSAMRCYEPLATPDSAQAGSSVHGIPPAYLFVYDIPARDVAAARVLGFEPEVSLQGYRQFADCLQPMEWVEELPDASAEPINPQALQAAGFVTLASEVMGFDNLKLPANLVFRTAAEWQAAWLGRSQGTEPVPEVDFDKYMVIGVARQGINGCDGIGVARIEQSASALIVHGWFADPPGPTILCTANYTVNNHFVLVPRSTLPVQFTEQVRSAALPAWGLKLQAKATAYENRSGGVIVNIDRPSDPGKSCNPLTVSFDVRAADGNLPQQLKVNAVTVAQYGLTHWLQPIKASDTGIVQSLSPDNQPEPVLRGVVNACTSPQFSVGSPVIVRLSVATADGQVELDTYTDLLAVE